MARTKNSNWNSALDVRELGRETVGGDESQSVYSKIDSRKTPNCRSNFVAETLGLATVCRSVTRCHPRRDLCLAAASVGDGSSRSHNAGSVNRQTLHRFDRLPGADYAVPLTRSMPRAATSTTAHTLRTDAAMKAEYAARPMRSQMLRPMVSAATMVSARQGAGSRS